MRKLVLGALLPAAVGLSSALAAPAASASAAPALAADTKASDVVVLACGGRGSTIPLTGATKNVKANTAIWGSPGYRQSYDVTLETAGRAALVEVKGWNSAGTLTWYSMGLFTDSSRHKVALVAWGNRAATPEIRIRSSVGTFSATIAFTC